MTQQNKKYNFESIGEIVSNQRVKIPQNQKKKKQRNFTQISNNLIDDKNLTIYEKMVFIVIERHMIGKNTCWPSIATISQKSRCGQTSTKKATKSLIEKGYLGKTKNNKVKSNVYRTVKL